ncbi:hypothetical protein OA416_01545 [Paracoccaceae bacterium]|nr:hypothetical protein [Paracoccaceae bacterium]
MKKALLTFLFCTIGFSVFSDEVFQCRTKSVDVKNDFEVRNFLDEESVGMRINLDEDKIIITQMTTNFGNMMFVYKIKNSNNYKIEAESCYPSSEVETCGWIYKDEKINEEKTKVLRKQTLTFFREQNVGTILYESNKDGVGIKKLTCIQI